MTTYIYSPKKALYVALYIFLSIILMSNYVVLYKYRDIFTSKTDEEVEKIVNELQRFRNKDLFFSIFSAIILIFLIANYYKCNVVTTSYIFIVEFLIICICTYLLLKGFHTIQMDVKNKESEENYNDKDVSYYEYIFDNLSIINIYSGFFVIIISIIMNAVVRH